MINFKNKNILITGASGFIGLYLKNYFIYHFKNLGIKNIILVDKNIKKLKKNIFFKHNKKKILIIKKDLLKLNFNKLKINIDLIFHAASIASLTVSSSSNSGSTIPVLALGP